MPTRGASSLQRFDRACHAVIEHAAAVLSEAVGDLGRWDAVRIGERGVQRHAVDFFRQIFAAHPDADHVAEVAPHLAVVVRSPGQRAVPEQVARGARRP
jgi:hypothetical protein